MSQLRFRRLAAPLVITLALGAGALPALGAASSPQRRSGGPVSVSIVDSSQRTMLRAGAVRVRVDAVRHVLVRLHLRARSGSGPIHTVAHDAVVGVGPGSRVVKLRLTSAGKRVLRSCGEIGLEVTATGKRFHASTTRTFSADLPRCRG